MAGFDEDLIRTVSGQVLTTWSDENLILSKASVDEITTLTEAQKDAVKADLEANPLSSKEPVQVQVRTHIEKIFESIQDQILNKLVVQSNVVTGGTIVGTTFYPEFGLVTGTISFKE